MVHGRPKRSVMASASSPQQWLNSTTRQEQTYNTNCYDTYRYGASRYALFNEVNLLLYTNNIVDRREHRQQRVRGAG
jgi:hypothetical protein